MALCCGWRGAASQHRRQPACPFVCISSPGTRAGSPCDLCLQGFIRDLLEGACVRVCERSGLPSVRAGC